MKQAQKIAPALKEGIERFTDHPLAGEIASLGGLSVIELVADKDTGAPFAPELGVGQRLIAFGRDHGLIVRAIGNRVGFSPPLLISEAEIGEMYGAFAAALDDTVCWLDAQN